MTRGDRVQLGAGVDWGLLIGADARYRNTFLEVFDSLTPQNEMKMDALQPQRARYEFAIADQLVAFAVAHGKQVRGHTTVWHKQLPTWLTRRSWARAELTAILKDHVQTVIGRYRGRISEWDVVNEPIAEDGTLRPTIWRGTLGHGYVADALCWAHEADPGARLYINDYNTELAGPKADRLYALAQELVAREVPLHGVGFQMHVSTASYPREAGLVANMRRFSDLGLGVDVTELDVRTSGTPGSAEERLAAQREVYRTVAAACRALERCDRLTTWGITDAHSWLGPAELPLPFDGSYEPKPAFAVLRETLALR